MITSMTRNSTHRTPAPPQFGATSKPFIIRNDETMKFGPKLSLLYYPGSYTRDDLVFLCRQADRVAQFTQAIEIYKPSPLEWRARIKGQEDREALSETMTQPTQNAQALDTLLTAMEAKAKSTAGSLDTTA